MLQGFSVKYLQGEVCTTGTLSGWGSQTPEYSWCFLQSMTMLTSWGSSLVSRDILFKAFSESQFFDPGYNSHHGNLKLKKKNAPHSIRSRKV